MSKYYTWEATPNQTVKLDDLNVDDIMKSIRDTVEHRRLGSWDLSITNPMHVLLGFHLLDNDNKTMVNAANVLFGKSPSILHPQCRIKLTRYNNINKPVGQLVNNGNLFNQYDVSVDFCKRYLRMSDDNDSMLKVPFGVIKEACTNMLVHRSWDDEDLYPGIDIYDDRVIFKNPCLLLNGITLDDFAKGRGSFLCNDIIIGVFYRRGYMWNWETGIDNIMKSCKAAGMPTPQYDFTSSSVSLTIRF